MRLDFLRLGDAMLGGLGGNPCPIDVCRNSYEFVNRYQLTIDGRPFDWDGYEHLVPLYQDDHPVQVLMAGAQTGKTARLLLLLTRFMLVRWGALFAYYFPDKLLPSIFSRDRFKPFLQSNPELGGLLGIPRSTGAKGVDNTLTRSLGESTVFFLTSAGRSSTEGLPLPGVFFDEVRRMARGDIERAMERYSAQKDPIDVKVSTARYNESDIHAYFLEGDQRYFHTDCRCAEGICLSLTYPDCIADLRKITPGLKRKVEHAFSHDGVPYLGMSDSDSERYDPAAYTCPTCGKWITRPRRGWWEPHATGYARSWQMPQLLSPTYPAGRVLTKSEKTKDVQEFWNSCIGLPYIDENKRPVKPEHLAACVNLELPWWRNQSALWRSRNTRNFAAGVDVQAGYHVLVIKAPGPNGKHRTVHLEIVHGPHDNDPWHTLARRLHEYDVAIAVIDQAPEWSAALRFARAHKGRVWLANYDTMAPGSPIVVWGDRGDPKNQKGKETKFKFRCNIDRTKGLQWSLGRWVQRLNETPDPRTLVQMLPRDGSKPVLSPELRAGRRAPVQVCAELYHDHLQRIIFRDLYEDLSRKGNEEREKRGERRIVAEYIGVDPHFAHADLFAGVALDRLMTR